MNTPALTTEELRAERDFLIDRHYRRAPHDYVGASSTALVLLALDGTVPTVAPADRDDLRRCLNTCAIAPGHLQQRMAGQLAEWTEELTAKEQAAREARAAARAEAIADGSLAGDWTFVSVGETVAVRLTQDLVLDLLMEELDAVGSGTPMSVLGRDLGDLADNGTTMLSATVESFDGDPGLLDEDDTVYLTFCGHPQDRRRLELRHVHPASRLSTSR